MKYWRVTLFSFPYRSLEVLFKYSSDLRALNERNTSFQTPLHVAVLANKPHNITALLKAKVLKKMLTHVQYRSIF